MKVVRPVIRTVSECKVCELTAQGVVDAEKLVTQQYVMSDPLSPPVPFNGDDPLFVLYPEMEVEQGKIPPSGGVVGTVMSFFRALGLPKGPEGPPPASKTIAKRNRSGGLYEK